MNNSEEKQASLILYRNANQVLVSPSFLRNNGVGQVDLLFFNDKFLSLVEVKKTGRISLKQKTRLRRSSQFIAGILDRDCRTELFNSERQVLMEF